ncbi:MAG: Imm63 family immunity protein [Candidatus Thorarchaeota archaeon]
MVKIYSISTIRKKVREYGKKINTPSHLLSVRSSPDGFGTPHIEIDENGYNYVVSERGREHERRQTKDITKLLYWILDSIVFIMASDYELENRKPTEDHRRQLFNKEIELMGQIDSKFLQWKKEEVYKILEEYPYEDDLYK